jgi:hypothetical protein
MPWTPELFTAPELARIWDEDERRRHLGLVPFFRGFTTGETDALIGSFVGEPEVHHPVVGRVRGVRAFERFAADTARRLREHAVRIEQLGWVLTPERGVEEVVLHGDTADGRLELPVIVATDHGSHGRIVELRVYFGVRALTGAHARRPPLLQPVDGLETPGVIEEYRRALAAGDVEAAVAAFEPGGYVQEPGGAHRGPDELRDLHARLFANVGAVATEPCTVTDDGSACVVEYNVFARHPAALAPEAGIAVYARGDGDRLAAVRMYDDAAGGLTRDATPSPSAV